jgi:hypothetical protein
MFSMKRLVLVLSLVSLLPAGCSGEKKVSFKKDVMPILQANCLKCHAPGGKGDVQSGFHMDTYENLMKGTKHGPVIMPGSSLNSVFNQVVEGRVDKSISMPHGGEMLSDKDIKTLKLWVDQGAENN